MIPERQINVMNPSDQLIAYIQKLNPLAEGDREQILEKFKFRKVKKNEFLLREGEVCNFNLFILKGSLRMYMVSSQGQELIRYFAFENKFGTDLTSLISGSPSNEYIQAIEKTELFQISKSDFLGLVDSIPAINRVYRNMLEQAYVTSQKRIYNFQGKTALEKLNWLLEYSPGILARIPSKMIASYLGITPFTLSRLKAEL